MEDSGGNSSDNEMKSSSSCPRGHWRPAEDEKLRKLVEQYGPQNWNSIAEKLQGRSGKSCRLRWFNQLDPRINRKPFTEEEEERLLTAHRIHGNKWALISRLFPGRTDNAVKNHWHVIMARMQRERSKQQTSKRGLISSSSNVSSNTSLSVTNHDFLSKTSKSLNISNYGIGLKSDNYHHNHGLHKFEQYISKERPKGINTSNTKGWSFAPTVLSLDKYRASSSSISTQAQSLQGNCNWVGGNSSLSSSIFEHSNGFASKILSSSGSSSILLDGGGQFGGSSSYGVNYYPPHKVVVPSSPLLFGQGQTMTTTTTTTMKRSSLLERFEKEGERENGGAMVSSNTKEVHFIDFLGVGISS